MRVRSPALNEEVFEREIAASGGAVAAAETGIAARGEAAAPPAGLAGAEPMTLAGVVRACLALLVILVGAGAIGWELIDPDPFEVSVPIWYWIALGGGLAVAILTIVRPRWARCLPTSARRMGVGPTRAGARPR